MIFFLTNENVGFGLTIFVPQMISLPVAFTSYRAVRTGSVGTFAENIEFGSPATLKENNKE